MLFYPIELYLVFNDGRIIKVDWNSNASCRSCRQLDGHRLIFTFILNTFQSQVEDVLCALSGRHCLLQRICYNGVLPALSYRHCQKHIPRTDRNGASEAAGDSEFLKSILRRHGLMVPSEQSNDPLSGLFRSFHF